MERAELVAQALVFLVRVTDEDVPLDEALNALSALAEQFQSGAIVGGTLIDSSSATFERVVYPSLLASPFSTLRHVPIGSPIFGTCAKAVREGKTISCSDTATEACFDVSWRSLYLGLGIHSVQSAPVFSFNGRPLGTFVVAIRQPHASFDTEMTGFGVYAMRTILQKPSCYNSGPPRFNLAWHETPFSLTQKSPKRPATSRFPQQTMHTDASRIGRGRTITAEP